MAKRKGTEQATWVTVTGTNVNIEDINIEDIYKYHKPTQFKNFLTLIQNLYDAKEVSYKEKINENDHLALASKDQTKSGLLEYLNYALEPYDEINAGTLGKIKVSELIQKLENGEVEIAGIKFLGTVWDLKNTNLQLDIIAAQQNLQVEADIIENDSNHSSQLIGESAQEGFEILGSELNNNNIE